MTVSIKIALDIYKQILQANNYQTLPCLLLGNIGIGKTEQVKSFAANIAKDLRKKLVNLNDLDLSNIHQSDINENTFLFLNLNATHLTPEFLEGIPSKNSDNFIMLPPIYIKFFQKYNGIIFIDEITNTPKHLQATLLKLILEKIAGFTKIRDDTIIIAAGNKVQDSTLANLLSSATLDRFFIFHVHSDFDEWVEYCKRNNNYNSMIIHFLQQHQEYFSFTITDNDLENYFSISPRKWYYIMQAINNMNDKDIDIFLKSQLRQDIYDQFLLFKESYIPNVQEITVDEYKTLNNEQKDRVIENIAKYLQTCDINKLNDKRFTELIQYLYQYDREHLSLFCETFLTKEYFLNFIKIYKDVSFAKTLINYSKELIEKKIK